MVRPEVVFFSVVLLGMLEACYCERDALKMGCGLETCGIVC